MRAKTVIPRPPGETTMQRLDAMVRMVFAAGKPGLTVEQPPAPPRYSTRKHIKKTTGPMA